MKTAYSLVRFSFARQHLGSSEERQYERHKAEAAHRGWYFNDNLCLMDLGVSAFRGKNFKPKYALGKFLEAAKAGLVQTDSVLMIENPDRFSRDLVDNADHELWALVKSGVDVLFHSNGLYLCKGDENDVAKRAILMFEFDRSHKESKFKSERVTASYDSRLLKAAKKEKVHLGLRPSWVDPTKDGGFVLNEKAAIVRRIALSYLDGKSMAAIATELSDQKVPALRYGKGWHQGQIFKLLRQELLLGHTSCKGKRFEGFYPAVITPDQWNKIQAKLAQNKSRKGGSRQGEGVVNIFRNRVFCAKCGSIVRSQNPKSHGEPYIHYYRCPRCKKHYVQIREVEEDFFGAFLKQNPTGLLCKHDAAGLAKIAEHQARIIEITRHIAGAMDYIGVIPKEELQPKIEAWKADRDAERRALLELQRQDDASLAAPAALLEIKSALELLENAEAPRQKDLYDKVVTFGSELERQLADQGVRAKLLSLIPGLVDRLTLDLRGKRYRVHSVTGETTGWRPIARIPRRSPGRRCQPTQP